MNDNRDNFIEKILTRGKEVQLSVSEKNEMRKALLNMMSQVPLAASVAAPRHSYSFRSLWMIRMPITIALVLALSAGTSFAAQRAIPGDILYPVKVGVNEKVETLLAVSPKGSASVGVKHALTRLEEAVKLAENGKLDVVTQAQVKEDFYQNIADIKSNLKKLEGTGDFNAAADINGKFEEALGGHLGAFVELSSGGGSNVAEVADIANSVGAELQSAQHERIAVRQREVQTATEGTTAVKAERALTLAEKRIMEVETYISSFGTTSKASAARDQAHLRLSRAHESVARGKSELAAGAYREAFTLFKESETLAQDAKLLAVLDARVKKGLTLKVNATPASSMTLRAAAKGKGFAEDAGDTMVQTLMVTPAAETPAPQVEIEIKKGNEETSSSFDFESIEGNIDVEVEHEGDDKDSGKNSIRVNISL